MDKRRHHPSQRSHFLAPPGYCVGAAGQRVGLACLARLAGLAVAGLTVTMLTGGDAQAADAESSASDARMATDELPALRAKLQRPAPNVDVSISTGYGFGRSYHPQYRERQISGMTFAIDLALVVSPRWNISLFASLLEMPVTYVGNGRYEKAGTLAARDAQPLKFRTGDASGDDANTGGLPIAPAMHSIVGGTRVEFSPSGERGLFMGVGMGVGRVDLSLARFGGAVDVRSGYRQFLGNSLALSVSIGVQGTLGQNTQTILPYGSAELRFRFHTNRKDFVSWRSTERG